MQQRTSSESGAARFAQPMSSCVETALATRLLNGVQSRFDVPAPAVCECWEEEVCVVGTMVDGRQRLVFVFVQDGGAGRFGALFDDSDAVEPDRMRGLDFDTLCGAVARHLWGVGVH